MTRHVLLTGGSGFIGRNFIERCGSRYEILAPRHKDLDLIDNLAVRNFFRENQIDAVVHSATKPGHRNALDPTNIGIANLHMFANLYESAREVGADRFLFLGSGSEFDMRSYRPNMREEELGTYIPADDTGFSKYVCSRMLEGHPGYVNVRFFGIFGQYEDYAIRFISNAICKTLFDIPVTLRQDRKFSYTYIDDGVDAIARFLDADTVDLRYNDYNVTPPEAISLLELARIVVRVAGKPDHPILVGTPGEGLTYSGDNARFTRLFPDFAFTPYEDAVKRLYTWYESRKNALDPTLLLHDK